MEVHQHEGKPHHSTNSRTSEQERALVRLIDGPTDDVCEEDTKGELQHGAQYEHGAVNLYGSHLVDVSHHCHCEQTTTERVKQLRKENQPWVADV